MRISDWSSDVCSSDLAQRKRTPDLLPVALKNERQKLPGFIGYVFAMLKNESRCLRRFPNDLLNPKKKEPSHPDKLQENNSLPQSGLQGYISLIKKITSNALFKQNILGEIEILTISYYFNKFQ